MPLTAMDLVTQAKQNIVVVILPIGMSYQEKIAQESVSPAVIFGFSLL